MTDRDHYPARIFWSDERRSFIAEAPDLPGCSAVGSTQLEALARLHDAIAAWVEAAQAADKAVPSPSRQPAPSGKVLVRMPQSMHEQLAFEARLDGVSLNLYINYVLARRREVTKG